MSKASNYNFINSKILYTNIWGSILHLVSETELASTTAAVQHLDFR